MPNVLRNLKILEVSSVDKGAGEGVRIVLMKRDAPVSKVWRNNGELPDDIKSVLPIEAQSVWRSAANSALNGGASEKSAIKQAWAAVKNHWKKPKDGDMWVAKTEGEIDLDSIQLSQDIDIAAIETA